jgi:hypothetical protein
MAREVFRAPEFWWKKVERIHGPDVPAPLLDTLVRAGRWVLHAIGSLLQLLWPSGSPLALTNVLRYVALAVVIVWLVWLATRWREVWRWITPKVAAAPSVTSGGAVSTALPDVARLLDQAGTALEREQAESVVRFGFLAVIAWLTTHGLIPANRAHTNREHLDALHHPRAAPFREGFRRLALPYERVCYGQRAMTIDDARTFLADCRTLMADDAVPS